MPERAARVCRVEERLGPADYPHFLYVGLAGGAQVHDPEQDQPHARHGEAVADEVAQHELLKEEAEQQHERRQDEELRCRQGSLPRGARLRILAYSPECVGWAFCELRTSGVLGST